MTATPNNKTHMNVETYFQSITDDTPAEGCQALGYIKLPTLKAGSYVHWPCYGRIGDDLLVRLNERWVVVNSRNIEHVLWYPTEPAR